MKNKHLFNSGAHVARNINSDTKLLHFLYTFLRFSRMLRHFQMILYLYFVHKQFHINS